MGPDTSFNCDGPTLGRGGAVCDACIYKLWVNLIEETPRKFDISHSRWRLLMKLRESANPQELQKR